MSSDTKQSAKCPQRITVNGHNVNETITLNLIHSVNKYTISITKI